MSLRVSWKITGLIKSTKLRKRIMGGEIKKLIIKLTNGKIESIKNKARWLNNSLMRKKRV